MSNNTVFQETSQYREVHFVVMAIEAAAKKMGISSMEMYNRLKQVDLIDRLLFDCYEPLHSQSLKHVAEDVVEALSNWENMKDKQ